MKHLKPSTAFAVYSSIITVLIIAAFLANFLLAHSAIESKTHPLCPIFMYLTHKKPPAKLKSANYFYQLILVAERKEGC